MKRLAAVLVATAAALPGTAGAHGRGCNTKTCDHRVAHDRAKRIKRTAIRPYQAWLERVALCESGGRWNLSTGNGFYGGLQFTRRSWVAVGGHGYPHQATRLEQMYRAVLLLHAQGAGAWPACSRA